MPSKACRGIWKPLPNTLDAVSAATSFRITHPFHPWFGQEFSVIERRPSWRENRVYFHDGKGHYSSLPIPWTTLAAPDLFLMISAGNAHFRPQDLLELADLIQRIRNAGTASDDTNEGDDM